MDDIPNKELNSGLLVSNCCHPPSALYCIISFGPNEYLKTDIDVVPSKWLMVILFTKDASLLAMVIPFTCLCVEAAGDDTTDVVPMDVIIVLVLFGKKVVVVISVQSA